MPIMVGGNKEAREMKGYLKKWTNYTSGYKLRWFVLEDSVLSYYKHQDDAGSACRGAINMRIAKLDMDPQDKLRFEIQGKSSVKYHLKANHPIEAKQWYWALNNAIHWSKGEAREEEKRQTREIEALKLAKIEQSDRQQSKGSDSASLGSTKPGGASNPRLMTPSSLVVSTAPGSSYTAGNIEDVGGSYDACEPSVGPEVRNSSHDGVAVMDDDVGDYDHDDYDGDTSSHDGQFFKRDAFSITAQSVKLQLDLLAQVSTTLQSEMKSNPTMHISDPTPLQALFSYNVAVRNLKGLIGDLLRISRDRDAYWQYRLDREQNVRRSWEESMAHVVREQEELETLLGKSEDKRKHAKKALRDAVEGLSVNSSGGRIQDAEKSTAITDTKDSGDAASENFDANAGVIPAKPSIDDNVSISVHSCSEDEEFFDAIETGDVEVVDMVDKAKSCPSIKDPERPPSTENKRDKIAAKIKESFKGYEDEPRTCLNLDVDDRPTMSLWAILKSMIGKDMTRMTLPVSFNEPTSLLQRVAEDMEYTDLIDNAAETMDATERLVHVAAFAASEYASTVNRVAKPFNPLLGETYEYVRPDKGYRFFIEQVSHHPPIGAAFAESANWDYYGESALKSKFYGKSFDINLLGTWFLWLRPVSGESELYTWKKVTSSVTGIISGNPTILNHGKMEIKNWSTGEICVLDFNPWSWRASSPYQVMGKVMGKDGKTRWSIGGRWNDKIYARLTPGYDGIVTPPTTTSPSAGISKSDPSSSQAMLIWECHKRPAGIPFNLTPFVVTLNALPDRLRPLLAPTDTRLRPDQRAMENGEYDLAASEKIRLEEKQRAKRREMEMSGKSAPSPRWFRKGECKTTGEEYWVFDGEYWKARESVADGGKKWSDYRCDDIF